jgi:hypothetical protein
MSITNSKLKKNYLSRQKKYRTTQQQKGLVRYEIQVNEEVKNRFEKAVTAVANEYTLPYSEKTRKTKARAQIFNEITKGIIHRFTELETQIESQRTEIKALSPSFFAKDLPNTLPQAINTLDDNPQQLKTLLAKFYQENQQLQLKCLEYKRQSDQFEDLYNAQYNYNKELENELKNKNL